MEAEARAASIKSTQIGINELQRLLEHRPTHKQPITPCYYIPFPRNTSFYRQERYLDEITSSLLFKTNQTSCFLYGLGGVGKTETALGWVYENKDAFDAIFWISAEKPERLSQGYVGIARCLGLIEDTNQGDPNRCLEIVFDWLASTGKSI